jgi:hypothetical protein
LIKNEECTPTILYLHLHPLCLLPLAEDSLSYVSAFLIPMK